MPRYLKDELPVSTFMEKTPSRRSPDRKSAQHERAGAETEILAVGLPVLADHLDRLDLPEPPFGDDEIRALAPKQIASVSKVRVLCLVGQSVDPRRQAPVSDTADRAVTELCPNPIPLTPLELCFERKQIP
ncbi:MAG: hypothetical protein H7039_22640 [Bryobacteraceae bacterium]|nr:hypothetical protein [Bryobacteraceae bacterium]